MGAFVFSGLIQVIAVFEQVLQYIVVRFQQSHLQLLVVSHEQAVEVLVNRLQHLDDPQRIAVVIAFAGRKENRQLQQMAYQVVVRIVVRVEAEQLFHVIEGNVNNFAAGGRFHLHTHHVDVCDAAAHHLAVVIFLIAVAHQAEAEVIFIRHLVEIACSSGLSLDAEVGHIAHLVELRNQRGNVLHKRRFAILVNTLANAADCGWSLPFLEFVSFYAVLHAIGLNGIIERSANPVAG